MTSLSENKPPLEPLPNWVIERMVDIYNNRGPQETKFEAMTKCADLVRRHIALD